MISSVYRQYKSVFDAARFRKTLENEANPLQVFRNTLKSGSDLIKTKFEAGTSVTELIAARSYLVDGLLKQAWLLKLPADADSALVAVGGYGRGELHPASDIDIMILLSGDDHDYLEIPIEQFLTFLWDIGLEVGHSVRTLYDCVREATQDITVATNLMESRLVVGNPYLVEEMRLITGAEKIWPSPEFFEAKWNEQRQRHLKYDDTDSNLEPNIKESPGGLRDIQTIAWVTQRHFGAATLQNLVLHGFLTEDEFAALTAGQEFLWKIRFALHIHTGRREDRILFDYQRHLADLFGFQDEEHNLAVEQFMQRYYRAVKELSWLNEIILQHFQEAILLVDVEEEPVMISDRFQARNGFLEVTRNSVFRETPHALLEVFLLMQMHPELKGVRATTIRLIRANLDLIDDAFRNSSTAQSLFMEILEQRVGITSELRRMDRYRVLAAYLPAFGRIVGRMQYDLFHVYTVDAHTLMVIRNLRRLTIPEFVHEFPICSRLICSIPKAQLLYLAALFHDIAKGRGGDHSMLGAKDAFDFCQLHGLSISDSRLVAWLVEHHLLMSMTAQRKDITDPEVVQAFAGLMADPVRLDYLYLLTVADSRATNPKRWNSWIDSLLRELYHAARRALLRGLDNPKAQDELIQEKQDEARRFLTDRGLDEERITRFWIELNLDYFLYNTADEIAWHTEQILLAGTESLPLVRVRKITERGGSEVMIYIPDRDLLFAHTTALLDQMGLNILDARILVTDSGMTMNCYQVLEEHGGRIDDDDRAQEIVATLSEGLADPAGSRLRVARRMPRQLKHFSTRTSINFSQNPAKRQTVMQLVTGDRPGLLSLVAQAFAECGIRLQNAKIATIGAEADDTFFIKDLNDQPVTDETVLDNLRSTVLRYLSEDREN